MSKATISKGNNASGQYGNVARVVPLAFVVLTPIGEYVFHLSPIWIFGSGVLAIAVLAEWIRVATDQLSSHTGPAIGGLLTVSLGSLAELILALFVLARGQVEVVHAQITGSIAATCLLGLGLAIVAGGFNRERQSFTQARAGLLSSMLVLSVIALLLPAVFDYTGRSIRHINDVSASDELLSLAVSVVLLILYSGNLVFTLITHRNVFATNEDASNTPAWSATICLIVLLACTGAAALQSDFVSGALTDAAKTTGVTPLFLGVVVLALVGTSSDIFAAVWFARRDQMGLVMTLCIGSAIQIALVVAPLLVIFSWLIGKPMTLVFQNPVDLFSIAGSAFIVNAITRDAETTWFEGLLLIGVYAVFALAYYFS
ncbi:calcium/proton exchanger [Bradyrhizobium centrosematis]|uniref:calcium/proton exchanger n=1 Tax=Bradyrhizobium centrosematis TaxID=1300039 RepID=UPI002168DAC1|nr:calcium/proton exchanger [Bradyrhizobium centrosematis]MCS3758695.1 Ca2+:H+ antiporter [Bradyrhizobium centrosematis]MCS3773417.1 Ca2+:H+ antiporter [Bradyrhizobium centrosematis]